MAGILVLESWGVPAEDTVVTFPAMEPRVILVRRGPPDNSVFAELRLPPGTIVPPDGRLETTLTLRPEPGVFGLDIVVEPGAQMAGSAELLFSYAVHFVTPEDARRRYGTSLAFEQALFIAHAGPNAEVRFLPSRRPGSDLLAASVTTPGRYLVAAPR